MKQNEEAGKKKRIDPEEAVIVEILDDVIRSEKKDWVKDLVENLKREDPTTAGKAPIGHAPEAAGQE